MKNSSNFCHHPFKGLFISAQGDFRPCCKYNGTMASNIRDYLASPELHELRQQFSQGERPTQCERCWKDEDAGIASKRQLDSQYIFDVNEQANYLDVTFGNSCNLACRTCSSYASSGWIKDERSLGINTHSHHDFFKDDQYKKDLYSHVATATDVRISGGEPFITGRKEHLEFLDHVSNDASITYTTNGTTRPADELWHRLKQFRQVELHVSIDGTDGVFEYLRYPARWNEVLENLETYREWSSLQDHVTLSISHTVSMLNAWNLPDFHIWCLKNRFPRPYIGMVTDPAHLNLQNLPARAKDRLAARLDRYHFGEITSFMMGTAGSDVEFDRFWNLTTRLDQLRSQQIRESLPEFIDLISDSIVK